ncbi:UNVERIFIED_CONTAM: hypothetical protein RMT77_015422 [Armadillidium vulgare]
MSTFNLHNIRFYDYHPEAIQCIAYSNELKMIALSRADGSIELWNCSFKPFKQYTIIGSKDSSVESLLWCGRKLFCAGFDGFILEYDITTYLVNSKTAVTGGPVWCLSLSPNRELLAAGTEGGYVCIYTIYEEGLMHKKILKKQNNRILSLGWGADNEHIVTGSINFIHLISVETEKTLQLPVVNTSTGNTKKETLVWCVSLLPDKTIVSGDSKGKTCFWDGTFGTLISSLQTHQADVHCMQVTEDSQRIYVAGVDPVIVEVCLVDSGGKRGKRKLWIKSRHRRIHTHDVRSLALTKEGKLFSGGVDTYLALSYYPPKTAIRYPATPPNGYISVARDVPNIILGYKNKVELWELGAGTHDNSDCRFLRIDKDIVKLVEIELKAKDRLQSCAVSPKGQWIALVCDGKIRIYKFTLPKAKNENRKLEKLKFINNEIEQSSGIIWINEEKLASSTYSDIVQILQIFRNEVTIANTLSIPSNCIARQMSLSPEGRFLTILDSSNQVTVFSLSDNKSYFVMPKSKVPVTAFALNENQQIVIAYSNMTMTEYNIENSLCTPFGKELLNNPFSEIGKSNNVVLNLSLNGSRIFLHSISSFHSINKNVAYKSPSRPNKTIKYDPSMTDTDSNDSSSLVRLSSNQKLSTVSRSNHILHFSFIKDNQVVSLEVNPMALLDQLPPTLKVKKFGAS